MSLSRFVNNYAKESCSLKKIVFASRSDSPRIVGLLVFRTSFKFIHLGFFDLLFFVPFHFVGAPVAKSLGREHELALTQAPVNTAVHLGGHPLHPSVITIHGQVKMLGLTLLALEAHKLTGIFRML